MRFLNKNLHNSWDTLTRWICRGEEILLKSIRKGSIKLFFENLVLLLIIIVTSPAWIPWYGTSAIIGAISEYRENKRNGVEDVK